MLKAYINGEGRGGGIHGRDQLKQTVLKTWKEQDRQTKMWALSLAGWLWTGVTMPQTPLSMGFSRQEYRSGLLYPPLGDLPDPGSKTWSPPLQADSLLQNHQGSPLSYIHTHKTLLSSWFKWYQLYRWVWDNGYFYNNESSCDEQMLFTCNVGKFIHLFLFLSCFRNIRLL